ncbi:MAG: TolC family protein [Bryobacteraceae bacterium]|nr:TolC family protein [Bryobacteraceae bacterium]
MKMRFLATFLAAALIVPAQQVQPGTPAPKPEGATVKLGEGASSRIDGPLGDVHAPWAMTGSWFRTYFGATDTRVVLEGPVRLKDYVVDGKLTLSLRAYLDLVVANNTDLAIQKLTLEVPKNAIQRAFGVFDPTLTSNFSATRATTPTTNQLQGALVLSTLNQPFNARYQQLLPTSTTVFSQLNWSKNSTNDTFQLFNPAYTNTWQMGFIQPLLRNRGKYITKLPITIARAQLNQQTFNTVDQIQRLILTAENAYWDVVSARERLKVQEQALALADAALKRAQRELELGATSPLEIFQPQQNYATAEIALTQVKYQLSIAEDSLRRQIGADLDPEVRKLPIVLTEEVKPEIEEATPDTETAIQTAMTNRPDLKAARTALDINDLQIQNALNAVKPLLNLQGSYQTYGRGGPGYVRQVTPPLFVPGGPGDAWGQLFGFDYNTFAFSLNLNLPLRDRAGAANLADATVNKRLNALRERSLEQQIRNEVLTAINQVENSKASVRLAQVALDYAQKRADADQKRYDLGVINIFFLLSAQNDLTTAQSNLVNQTVQYRRNALTLQQRLGTLLQSRGIVIQ